MKASPSISASKDVIYVFIMGKKISTITFLVSMLS